MSHYLIPGTPPEPACGDDAALHMTRDTGRVDCLRCRQTDEWREDTIDTPLAITTRYVGQAQRASEVAGLVVLLIILTVGIAVLLLTNP